MVKNKRITRRKALAGMGLAVILAGEGIGNYLAPETPRIVKQKTHTIAHRKHSDSEIEQAIKSGADMVEFDVRQTQNKVYVAYHDSELNGKPISELEYTELQGVSRVEDLLKQYADKTKWDIHLKEQGYERELLDFLDLHLEKGRYIITSEHLDSLKKIREIDSETKLGLILLKGKFYSNVPLKTLQSRFSPSSLLTDVKENQLDFIVPDYRFVTRQVLDKAEKQDIQVIPWTVNDKVEIQRFSREPSVYGVVTDNPELNKPQK